MNMASKLFIKITKLAENSPIIYPGADHCRFKKLQSSNILNTLVSFPGHVLIETTVRLDDLSG